MTKQTYERRVARAASAVSGAIALVAIPVGSALAGWPGFWGAVVGAAVVVIFLVIHVLVAAITRNMDPISTMALAMFAYFAKVMALAGFLIAFRGSDFLDRPTFGVTAICVTSGWLAAEIRTFTKSRFVLSEGYVDGRGSEGRRDG
jgi:hypothetical protein